MVNKPTETLLEIEKKIQEWRNGEVSESSVLDDIHDLMSELSDWEDAERRRLRREEMERNTITIKSKVQYMGELKLPRIDFDGEEK